MKEHVKNKLKIILPIVFLVFALAVTLIIILIPKEITQKNYFNSFNANFTKQVQNTTITENQTLVYQKKETIVFDGKKVYHKIEEKILSSSLNVDYDEITTEYYYTNDKMYYFEENVWKTQDFNISESFKSYDLKKDYFINFEFDKKIEDEGCFVGNIKDENINDVFKSETNFKNGTMIIKVDKKFNIKSCDITAKTSTNRDVVIQNIFTYEKESVVLPS